MNRLLKSSSWCFSLLAVLCLVLGLLAMPTAMVRGDEPAGPLFTCGGYGANGCTWDQADCDLACPTIPGNNQCKCKWGGFIGNQQCGCFAAS